MLPEVATTTIGLLLYYSNSSVLSCLWPFSCSKFNHRKNTARCLARHAIFNEGIRRFCARKQSQSQSQGLFQQSAYRKENQMWWSRLRDKSCKLQSTKPEKQVFVQVKVMRVPIVGTVTVQYVQTSHLTQPTTNLLTPNWDSLHDDFIVWHIMFLIIITLVWFWSS